MKFKIFNKLKYLIGFALILILFTSTNLITHASSNKLVILGGNSIGLKLDTGVYVAGKYEVETKDKRVSPWASSDILEGDKIVAFNGSKIKNNSDLLTKLKNEKEGKVNLTIKRNDRTFDTQIDVVITKNNDKSLGLYIKDRILGIGTLTFIDPETSKYASLGHGIYDDNLVIGTQLGSISKSNVEGIKKGIRGEAGEKRATFSNVVLGSIYANKITGVYGKITNKSMLKGKTIEVASQEEVKIGKAQIYTVIDGEKIESFDIKITYVNLQDSTNVKGIRFEVIDNDLIDKTGGIIQGMSGSPIVQNNKLVGAVSHVSIDNPTIGYGVHIEWMMLEM